MTHIHGSDRLMYRWRKLTPQQRQEVLDERKQLKRPWHSPPHYESDNATYLITAACYEHKPLIGRSPSRMVAFETELLQTISDNSNEIFAWCILPNHYHVLLCARELKQLLGSIGQLHGRTSYLWNGEDNARGRQVWCRAAETAMKSDRHFWATMNYVLHNAVRHGYVKRWQDWPYSNAAQYLEEIGREKVTLLWNEYPVLNYGDEWDPPEL